MYKSKKVKLLMLMLVLVLFFSVTFSVSSYAKNIAKVSESKLKISPDHWAYQSVKRLVDLGIVEGYPDGTFQGNEPISRYEIAAITDRALRNLNDKFDRVERKIWKNDSELFNLDLTLSLLAKEFRNELELLGNNIDEINQKIKNLDNRISKFEKPDTGIVVSADIKKMYGENTHSWSQKNQFDYGGETYNINTDVERTAPLDMTVLELGFKKNSFVNQKLNEKVEYIEANYITNLNDGEENIELESETTIEGLDETSKNKGLQGKKVSFKNYNASVLTEKKLFKTPFKLGFGFNHQEQNFKSTGEKTEQNINNEYMSGGEGKGTTTEMLYEINNPYILLEANKKVKGINTNHQIKLTPYSTIKSQYNNYYFGEKIKARDNGYGIGYSLEAKKEIKENISLVFGLDADYKKYNDVEFEVYNESEYTNVEEYYSQFQHLEGEIEQKTLTVGLGVSIKF